MWTDLNSGTTLFTNVSHSTTTFRILGLCGQNLLSWRNISHHYVDWFLKDSELPVRQLHTVQSVYQCEYCVSEHEGPCGPQSGVELFQKEVDKQHVHLENAASLVLLVTTIQMRAQGQQYSLNGVLCRRKKRVSHLKELGGSCHFTDAIT